MAEPIPDISCQESSLGDSIEVAQHEDPQPCSSNTDCTSNSEPVTIENLISIRKSVANDLECAQILLKKTPYQTRDLNSLRRSINYAVNKVKTLKKKNSKHLKEYLTSLFHTSDLENEIQSPTVTMNTTTTKAVIKENKNLKRKSEELQKDNNTLKIQVSALNEKLEEAIRDLSELSNEKNAYTQKSKELQEKSVKVRELSEKVSLLQQKLNKKDVRNLNKKIKRRDTNIDTLKSKLNEIENKENVELNEDYKNERLSLQKTVSRLKSKLKQMKEAKSETHEQKQHEMLELQLCISEKENYIQQLEAAQNLLDNGEIKTFENGKYTNEIRECCMTLITECNVSLSKLPAVVNTVLQTLTGKVAPRLPSKSLLSWLTAEAKAVASTHVLEKMLENYNPADMQGNTLHQDATTKFHEHFEGFQVTVKSGDSYTIGLKNVSGGSADTYLKAFNDTIDDLTQVVAETGKEEVRAKLITSIKNYMSDQCATNHKLNESFDKLRNELIPAMISNFESLTENEKHDILATGKYSCRLHLLANFGTCSDKALAVFEKTVCDGENPHSFKKEESSGTYRLIRSAAKALTKRGSDKAGVESYWSTYLKGKAEKNNLVTFHGHRINIAFHDGAAVYYHRNHISEFLDDWPEPNQLLKSVGFDIKEKVLLAGCRALGIMDKLVTAPFWQILEADGSILDLNEDLYHMKQKLEQWANDGSLPFSGEEMFQSAKIKDDHLFAELFKETDDVELDAMTQMALELVAGEMLIILERQAAQQLPGGQYWEPSKVLQSSSSTVPKTNVISERDMAMLDNLIRLKPAASALTRETLTMCIKNKPFQWLNTLTNEEKESIINGARKIAPEIRQRFKERQERVENELKEKLQEKQKKVEKKEQKELNLKVQCTSQLVAVGGLWESEESVLKKVEEIEDDKKIKIALLAQIKFHKNVLKSKGPKKLFQESSNNKKHTIDELKQNLIEILTINNCNDNEETSKGFSYKPIADVKEEIVEKKKELFAKVADGRRKIRVKQSQQMLPEFLTHPEGLVGLTVKHKCIGEDGQAEWFDAEVLSIKEKNVDQMKTEYNVKYSDDEDTWFFPLLKDLKKGDLIIV